MRANRSSGSARKRRRSFDSQPDPQQFATRRQAFGIADHLHCTSTDPAAAARSRFDAATFEQRADDADREAVAGTDGIDYLRHRRCRHVAATGVSVVEVRAVRSEPRRSPARDAAGSR